MNKNNFEGVEIMRVSQHYKIGYFNDFWIFVYQAFLHRQSGNTEAQEIEIKK